MLTQFIHVPIESYVDHISLTRFSVTGKKLLQPDGCWDLTMLRRNKGECLVRMYHATKAVVIDHEPGDEILAISFKQGVFVPFAPHDARHDKGFGLPLFGQNGFMVGGDRFEIPSPESTPQLVQRLVQKGILQSHTNVAAALNGETSAVSGRTLQRAFLQSTGVTQKYLTQIKRAQETVSLLQSGVSAVQVAGDLGYTDQAHMTKSLKYLMGQTPKQVSGAIDSVLPWRLSDSYELLATFH